MNPHGEYFIRELTRKLDEQINSVRRELDNLKKLGFLRAKTKNRKKYYYVNKNFIFLDELKSIIIKAVSSHQKIAKDLEKLGDIKLLALSGQFINKPTTTVDMLIVGTLNKEKFSNYLSGQLRTQRSVKFTIMDEQDYKYRWGCKDKFIMDIILDPENQIPINKISR
ncbi:hypothetical protein GF366_00335 [Candidatus Peregrinibacteria bacterium]|nr:hypothetical protein [Candidatus Peregrinibacteria bacterium]